MKECIDCGNGITKVSTRCKSCSNRFRKGKYHAKPDGKFAEKNPMWEGDNVGMKALHEWIKNHKPKPQLCERSEKESPFDLANINGEYKRDIIDFEWLCRKCHMESDGRMNNLKQYSGEICAMS